MYNSKDLSVLAYANNFTLWHYVTTDKMTTILEANYFNNSADMFNVNDLIICQADTDGEAETKHLIVTGSDRDKNLVTVKIN